MSTLNLDAALTALPAPLRRALLRAYEKIKQNYREQRWEASALNGGKLCEVVYRVLQWHTTNNWVPLGTRIPNLVDACGEFAHADKSKFVDSVRLTIPRMLVALYDVRSKRGVGHPGGDVDENRMDATVVAGMADWIVAELVRLFHGLSTDEAQELVDAVVAKQLPAIWHVGGRRRVMDPSLAYADQTLLILYHAYPTPLSADDLLRDVEYSNSSMYRNRLLRGLHKQRLIEYRPGGPVSLSPKGRLHVEQEVLPGLS
jgi:hypothetical protein